MLNLIFNILINLTDSIRAIFLLFILFIFNISLFDKANAFKIIVIKEEIKVE